MERRARGLTRSSPGRRGDRLHTVTRIATASLVVVATCVVPSHGPQAGRRPVAATPAAPTVTIDGEAYPNPLRLDNGAAAIGESPPG